MARWLELSADYRCNNRCQGCFSVDDAGPSMTTAEAIETLRFHRERGAEWLWLGGGEPTLRRDLFALVGAARDLGFSRVRLQTNGMLLAYPQFARRCFEAGVSEISFGLRSATAQTHDRLTRTPGSFDLLVRGIAEWKKLGRPMEGDVLLYRSNLPELPEIVRTFHDLGLARFSLWLFSTTDTSDASLDAEVPRIQDAMAEIARTMALRIDDDATRFITSLHTPPCTVPEECKNAIFFPAELDLVVANTGGHHFRLETSPIEGGHYTPRCAACAMRPRCNGARRDYVRIHGDAELQPLPKPRAPELDGAGAPFFARDRGPAV